MMQHDAASRKAFKNVCIALPIAGDFGVYVEGFVSSLENTGAQVELGW